jgi:hypothetical protein
MVRKTKTVRRAWWDRRARWWDFIFYFPNGPVVSHSKLEMHIWTLDKVPYLEEFFQLVRLWDEDRNGLHSSLS